MKDSDYWGLVVILAAIFCIFIIPLFGLGY